MKTIRVTGTGRASEAPDTIEITISFTTIRETYDKTIARAEEKADLLSSALYAAGFRKEDLKLKNFRVDTYYESYCDKNGNYKQHYKGYECTQVFTLEFSVDMILLDRAMKAIGSVKSTPKFSIRFMLKNTDIAVRAMLADAAKNAAITAEVLCKASGAQLGSLQSIDYSFGTVNFYSETEFVDKCMDLSGSAAECSMEYHPSDVDMTGNVTFIWEII